MAPMRFHCAIPLIAAAANLVIGGLVLRHGHRDRLHRSFAWFTLNVVAWNLGVFSLYYFQDPVEAEWWSRIFRTGIVFAGPSVFHFTLVFVRPSPRAWERPYLWAGYALAGLTAIANLRGLLVSGLIPHEWGWYIVPTRLYGLLTLLILGFLPLSAWEAWDSYRHPPSPRLRTQAKFWFLAAAVDVPLVLTNLLQAYGVSVYPMGNLGNVLSIGIMGYAIARHRLMDVDYVVRKGVSFVLAATVVLLPGGVAIAGLSRLLGAAEPPVVACASVLLALVAVVLVPAFQRGIETRVQRALFPHLYDYRQRLRRLAAGLVHILDQGALVHRLGEELADILDVESLTVAIRDERGRTLQVAYPASDDPACLPATLEHAFDDLTAPILASELVEIDSDAGAAFRAHRWEVAVPLRINERLLGVVMLGRNRDFRIFSAEDLQVLEAVASGASVAFENANLSRQLRHSEVVLERANRLSSLGMLAAGIAHEIRNPLVAVKTFLDLLPNRLEDREFLTRFRDLSLSELRRVTDLIADLLTLGKSTSTERRVVEVFATVEPVVRLMESTARKRQVTLDVQVERRLPSVLADPDQLKQIVLNLLLNAIEMSPPDGIVTLALLPTSTGISLEVRDQGPGIPPEQREDIFAPFFTTKESGTGLGLALVHQMVVEHGGDISVDSTVGRGSTFRVKLPAAEVTLGRTGT